MLTEDVAQRIIRKYDEEARLRTERALAPIRADNALGELAPLSVCDNCGKERKCKVYPISNGNAILCYRCFVKEENALRMSYRSADTTNWSKLKWYGVDYEKTVPGA